MVEKSRGIQWTLGVLCVVVLVCIFWISWHFAHKSPSEAMIALDARTISLADISFDIAQTSAEREQGLSGREGLTATSGMLFIFETPGRHSFWMKDMKFPIDIIWLDENFVITYIKSGATPESYPETFESKADSLYAIELKAGEAERRNLKVGTKVGIKAVDNSNSSR